MREDWWPILTLVILASIFAVMIWRVEKRSLSAKELALYTTMAALSAAARIPFAVIMSFQPTTFLVLLTGYVFGGYAGFLTGAGAAFISNFFCGQGPWTPWQMLTWGLVGISGGFLGSKLKGWQQLPFIVVCFIWGWLYGWIMNIWHYVNFVYPHTLQTLIATYVASIPYEFLHSLGNILFTLLFGKSFYLILHRFHCRLISSQQTVFKEGGVVDAKEKTSDNLVYAPISNNSCNTHCASK